MRNYGSFSAGSFNVAQLACPFRNLHLTREGTMIRKIAIAAVLGASAVYFIYPDVIDAPGYTPAGQTHPGNKPTPQQPAAMGRHVPVITDDGTEVVLGLRVRRDRNCRVELRDYVTTDGEMFSAYSCTPNVPAPPHIYAD